MTTAPRRSRVFTADGVAQTTVRCCEGACSAAYTLTMSITAGELLRTLSERGHHEDIPSVWNAYEVASDAHRGQRRANGDRYITHPLEVAAIVASQGGSGSAVCAALLHDVIEDADLESERLHAEFGSEVATMVDSMTSRAIRTDGIVNQEVGLVTVADRLHNLRTLRRQSVVSRQRVSLDTLVFHVPLAHRLSAPELAAEMTDLACTTLAHLDRRGIREQLSRMTESTRGVDPRTAIEVAASLGGAAAIVGSEAMPEWALASGGIGMLALVAAAVFNRDPAAAKRLADLIAAWRRGEG